MAEKGFAKAKDVERVSAEEMKERAGADAADAVECKRANRAKKVYSDEFTEGPEDEANIPEELDEPEVPEKKPKESKVRAGEETAKAIYAEGYQAGFVEGHKKARAEFLERLVG